MKTQTKIAVLTSGGDAPGMNATIRAVVRTAIHHDMEVFGIRRGFQGLVENALIPLVTTSVSNILQRGGTILKTARSDDFQTKEGRALAYKHLSEKGITQLVVLGGDGSFRGAMEFNEEYPDINVVGIPCTIDKDISGTDYTIGFDTAVNTAVEAIDKIRDTAHAHDRLFIVEVMGRDTGYIALHSSVACGAEDILIPETVTNMDRIMDRIASDAKREKLVRIIVVAEGDDIGGVEVVKALIKKNLPEVQPRIAILGHIQRGGSPSYHDRWVASHFGYHAIKSILRGEKNVMVGFHHGEIRTEPMGQVKNLNNSLKEETLIMAKILSS